MPALMPTPLPESIIVAFVSKTIFPEVKMPFFYSTLITPVTHRIVDRLNTYAIASDNPESPATIKNTTQLVIRIYA